MSKNLIHSTIDELVPFRLTSSSLHQPWITNSLKRLCRIKQRKYNIARYYNTQKHWEDFKAFKKQVQSKCKQAHLQYVCRICDDNKKFWKYIKHKRMDHCGIASLKHGTEVVCEGHEKANILNEYFSGVFTREDDNVPTSLPAFYPCVCDPVITLDGVVKLLQDLKSSKASGPDMIPNRVLKEAAVETAPFLVLLFQASLDQGILPKEWKHAYVSPIYKKGDRSLPVNYRPVSLTCTCCKVMEHIVYSSVIKHFESNGILSEAQHGFRKHHSCITQLVEAVHDFADALDKGQQLDAVTLDFSKAFDKVPHRRLCKKLFHYGIQGKLLQWIRGFLSNRTQQVVLDGCSGASVPVISGVPQGTVLGPLLFLCYVNDIPNCVSSKIRLYADDILIYRVITCDTDSDELQKDLVSLQKWSDEWQMFFNPQKCYFIRFSYRQVIFGHGYFICNVPIQECDSIKYLGVTIDSRLNWSEHVDAISHKANQVRGFLQRNLRACSRDVKLRSYKMYVDPILDYASAIWSPYLVKHINKLESIQRFGARFITGKYDKTCSVSALLRDLQLPRLELRRQYNRAVLMYMIVNGLVNIPIHSSLLIPVSVNTRGHFHRFCQLSTRILCFYHSFFPAAIKIWNSLPSSVINCTTVEHFGLMLHTHVYTSNS